MTMTRAELARALYAIAVELENSAAFHKRYTAPGLPRDAMIRRTHIWDAAKELGRSALLTAGGLGWFVRRSYAGREYIRCYLDMAWGLPDADKNAFPDIPLFEFWLDSEQWPDRVRAGESQPQPQPQPQPQLQPQPTETVTMIKITTKTLLNGKDIAEMTDEQLFDAIAAAETEIAKCQAIANKPKALEAKIAELQAGIVTLVAHMDAKV